MRTKNTLLTLLLVFSFSTLFAQNNFNGNYQLDTAKTAFGQLPHTIVPPVFKVQQQGTNISINRSLKDAQGKSAGFTESFSTADTVKSTLPNGDTRKAVLTWNGDKSGFNLRSFSYNTDGTLHSTIAETWSLEDNNQELVVERNVEQGNGLTYSIRIYYKKQ